MTGKQHIGGGGGEEEEGKENEKKDDDQDDLSVGSLSRQQLKYLRHKPGW